MKKTLLVASLLAVSIAGCGKKEEAPAPATPAPAPAPTAAAPAPAAADEMVVKIGHVAPISGAQAHLGKDNENGAVMAIDELNAKGVTIECEFCHELHFKGRTGVFELFVIDDEAKNAVLSGASGTQLKMVFRKQRGRYLQEQALLLVENGETSVQEVLRVLKAEPASAAKPPATGAAPTH
jgi:hypothetical protein